MGVIIQNIMKKLIYIIVIAIFSANIINAVGSKPDSVEVIPKQETVPNLDQPVEVQETTNSVQSVSTFSPVKTASLISKAAKAIDLLYLTLSKLLSSRFCFSIVLASIKFLSSAP